MKGFSSFYAASMAGSQPFCVVFEAPDGLILSSEGPQPVGLRQRPAVVSLPLGPDCSLFRVIENLCHIGRKQELRQKGDIGASLPPSCDMSGVTRRGGG